MAEGRRRERAGWVGERLAPRRLCQLLLGLILGLVLLFVAARGTDLGAVWRGVRRAELAWVGLSLLAALLTTATKIARWRGLVPGSRRLRAGSVARALLVGQMVNAVLPARLGEVARFTVLGREGGVSRATVLGTIAAEKAFDVLFLLITAGLTAALAPLPSWATGSLAGMAALGGALLLAGVAVPRGWARRLPWPERAARWLPWPDLGARAARLLERVLTGLEALRDPRRGAAACAWSAVIWALAAVTNLVLFRAFELPLSIGAALLLLTLLHLGTAPPSSPGRLGVFHALTVVALAPFGVDRAAGLAYGAVLHAVVYGPQVVLGAVALGLRPRRREAGS